MRIDTDLPIQPLIPEIQHLLADQEVLILEAEPGAGKTTAVPLALIGQPWLADQKIMLLEPRRIAAKTAAERLADTLDQPIGETVGLRLRLERRVSKQTKLEVITEGVLVQQLLADPELQGVGLVIFDEFHERSLQADLALTLIQEVRQLREQPLRVLIMSATLDSEKLSTQLGACPVLSCPGRNYPIVTQYTSRPVRQDETIFALVKQIRQALAAHTGDLLVFLPGRAEILRVERMLCDAEVDVLADIQTLFGGLSVSDQQAIVNPATHVRQRIILATPIAQTSVTIDGVSVVIDSGLERRPEFNPQTGITQLITGRISRASAQQRTGRAGRTQAGYCYRLWSESQHTHLRPYDDPEISEADLSQTCLQLLRWGIDRPETADWLDPPKLRHWQRAQLKLAQLGILDNSSERLRLTELGTAICHYPVEPEIALILERSKNTAFKEDACLIAAYLSDPIKTDEKDLTRLLPELAQQARFNAIRQLAARFSKLTVDSQTQSNLINTESLAAVLLSVFPDRIAKNSGNGRFILSSGKALSTESTTPFRHSEWILGLDLGGRRDSADLQLRLGVSLSTAQVEQSLKHLIEVKPTLDWEGRSGRPTVSEVCYLGTLELNRRERTSANPEQLYQALTDLLVRTELSPLKGLESLSHWIERVNYLAMKSISLEAVEPFDPLTPEYLISNLTDWFTPDFSAQVKTLNDLESLDLKPALYFILPWQIDQWLDTYVPEYIQIPSGRKTRVRYTDLQPQIEIKLQEMFGAAESLKLASGDVIQISMLSPAQRPVALTKDLKHFWSQTYPEIRKELRGRYSKHPWPEDPLNAQATDRTNAALNRSKPR